MPQRTQDHGAMGRLPAAAPLANPYVPFQVENPPVYDSKKGIVRGTLFPGLDLPFMGMVNTKEKNQTRQGIGSHQASRQDLRRAEGDLPEDAEDLGNL